MAREATNASTTPTTTPATTCAPVDATAVWTMSRGSAPSAMRSANSRDRRVASSDTVLKRPTQTNTTAAIAKSPNIHTLKVQVAVARSTTDVIGVMPLTIVRPKVRTVAAT